MSDVWDREGAQSEEPEHRGWMDRLLGMTRVWTGQAAEAEQVSGENDSDASLSGANPLFLRSSAPVPKARTEARQTASVAVRRSIQTFDDASIAVAGLSDGELQIINLMQTSTEMAERVLDFMNGAACALDCQVEKVGDHIYLFTPAGVQITVPDAAAYERRFIFSSLRD